MTDVYIFLSRISQGPLDKGLLALRSNDEKRFHVLKTPENLLEEFQGGGNMSDNFMFQINTKHEFLCHDNLENGLLELLS